MCCAALPRKSVQAEDELLQADIAARAEALDVSRSFIVQAPAGSGKTELLIQRYLRLLAIVDEPEEVLAITFTRKAAAEMRERVVAALMRAVRGEVPRANHERTTYDAAAAVMARDLDRGWELVSASRRMRIQTLDSLCAGIARLLPVTSGLGAGGAVVQDAPARQLYRAAALATLDWLVDDDAAGNAVETVLGHLDNNTSLYIDYVARMLQSRDQWLNITGSGDLDEPDEIRARLESNIRDVIEHHLGRLRRRMADVATPELPALARYAADNLVTADGGGKGLRDLRGLDDLPSADAGALEAWQCLGGLLLTGQGRWRKQVDRRQGFPPGDKGQKAAWKDAIEVLAGSRDLSELLANVGTLPEARYSDPQWRVLVALFRLLPLAVTELKRQFALTGKSDHVEVAMAASAALGSAEAPGDLALMLDYRISHMLVDEMQDTSISQYQMLETLTAGWSPGDGRSFFCVGDPMQSIYRFRNAEVGQFVRARERGLQTLPLESLTLRRNFRSGEHLVHWFNTVFSEVFPVDDDPASGAVSYSESVPVESLRDLGEYAVHPLFSANVDEEAAFTASLIEDRLAASDDEDLAILVRSRTQLPELLGELRRRQIPYQAVDIDRLTDLPEIIDLLALTRAMSHRDDRSAWLALLRGPLVGLTWSDLHRLVFEAPDACVAELLEDEERIAGLSPDGRRLVERFRLEVSAFLSVDRVRPLRERVEIAWFRLGGPACLAHPDQIANAYRFLEVVEKVEVGGTLPDPAAIQTHLEDERVSSPAHEHCRVQVMTMHKAKGLQFDHVVLPSLGRYTSGAQRAVLTWLNVPADEGGSDLVLSPVGPSYELESDPLHKYIETAEKISDRLEQDRLLYVACTRARHSLQLIGSIDVSDDGESLRAPDARTLMSRLWPAIESTVVAAFNAAPVPRHDDTTRAEESVLVVPTLRRLASDWRPPAAPPLTGQAAPDARVAEEDLYEVQFDWVGAAAREAGTIVHRWLEQLATGPVPSSAVDIDPSGEQTRGWARQIGVSTENLPAVCRRVGDALSGILDDERGRWILEGPGHAELALTGIWRGRVASIVLDRVRIDDEAVHWIVDYKTSTHEGGNLEGFLEQEAERYRQQLERYRSIYGAWSGAAEIRTALYFPMMKIFREVPTSG